MTTWKAVERAIAKRLGGDRVPITGRVRGSAPDVAHTWLAIEIKLRENYPQWLSNAMEQAEASRRGSQLPVAILHKKYKNHDDDLIVMRLSEFEAWFGRLYVYDTES